MKFKAFEYVLIKIPKFSNNINKIELLSQTIEFGKVIIPGGLKAKSQEQVYTVQYLTGGIGDVHETYLAKVGKLAEILYW